MPINQRSDIALGASGSRSLPTADFAGEPLRVGIAGAGKMGQHHARAIRRLANVARVVAVADPAPAAREAMQQTWPEAIGFSSLEELLSAGGVDVVHVCTAPETHARLAELALIAGCHTYVEKPAAESVASAERLSRVAAERGRLLCAGHQLLFEAPMRAMRDLLPSLGTTVHAESFFSFRPVRRAPTGGRLLPSDLQLLDILPHPVYLLLYLLERAQPEGQVELAALELGRAGTVHAIIRRGTLSGTLIVTLEGRPVESYLRAVGTNGTVHADFVRGTAQRLVGPGTSGIDKALNPFRLAKQMVFGTGTALGGRMLKQQRSYPGLAEIFAAFYASIRTGAPSPVSPGSIIDTVRICERVAAAMQRSESPQSQIRVESTAPAALVTGGTGFLGKAVVEALAARSKPVRAVARRLPAAWERIAEVEYVAADLGAPLSPTLIEGVDVVIHCAAETAGGWKEHERNSIAATEHVLRAAASAGVRRVIHVSSLATLAPTGREPLGETTPLIAQPTEYGPYVWGKVESERLLERLGGELGVEVRIVRPGALVDYERFDPPGRLGRRVGNIFVAVGSPNDPLGVVDVHFAGQTIAWMAEHFATAPRVLNLLEPRLPTRRALVNALRSKNPDLTVIWLPKLLLAPMSWLGIGLQKALRPGKPAVNVARVFASQSYDTSTISRIAPAVKEFVLTRSRSDAPMQRDVERALV